jgi:excisionase family DNA binding protein
MPDENPRFLTAQELANRIRCHRETVYEMLQGGEVPGARKIGGRWRIPEKAVDEIGVPAHEVA